MKNFTQLPNILFDETPDLSSLERWLSACLSRICWEPGKRYQVALRVIERISGISAGYLCPSNGEKQPREGMLFKLHRLGYIILEKGEGKRGSYIITVTNKLWEMNPARSSVYSVNTVAGMPDVYRVSINVDSVNTDVYTVNNDVDSVNNEVALTQVQKQAQAPRNTYKTTKTKKDIDSSLSARAEESRSFSEQELVSSLKGETDGLDTLGSRGDRTQSHLDHAGAQTDRSRPGASQPQGRCEDETGIGSGDTASALVALPSLSSPEQASLSYSQGSTHPDPEVEQVFESAVMTGALPTKGDIHDLDTNHRDLSAHVSGGSAAGEPGAALAAGLAEPETVGVETAVPPKADVVAGDPWLYDEDERGENPTEPYLKKVEPEPKPKSPAGGTPRRLDLPAHHERNAGQIAPVPASPSQEPDDTPSSQDAPSPQQPDQELPTSQETTDATTNTSSRGRTTNRTTKTAQKRSRASTQETDEESKIKKFIPSLAGNLQLDPKLANFRAAKLRKLDLSDEEMERYLRLERHVFTRCGKPMDENALFPEVASLVKLIQTFTDRQLGMMMRLLLEKDFRFKETVENPLNPTKLTATALWKCSSTAKVTLQRLRQWPDAEPVEVSPEPAGEPPAARPGKSVVTGEMLRKAQAARAAGQKVQVANL